MPQMRFVPNMRNCTEMRLGRARLWLAVAPLAVLAGPAYGVDLFAMPPPGTYSWTGFYAGANLGRSVGQGGGTMPYSGVPGLGSGTFLFNAQPSGVLGGGQAGYNYQLGNVVLGLETDIAGSGANDNIACFLSCLPGSVATLDHKLAWFGTTRGRAGWASGPIMTYVTLGAAYGETDSTLMVAAGGVANSLSVARTAGGWTWGTGIEAALAGNWTAKAEYLYVNLGTSSGSVGRVAFNAGNQERIYRGGVNYQFTPKAEAAVMPLSLWSGAYVGADLGYGVNRDPSTFLVANPIAGIGGPANESFNLTPRGYLGGGVIGYNWQAGPFVGGLDADLAGELGRGYFACAFLCGPTAAAGIDQQMTWLGTVRARGGYTVGPSLFYATVGLAQGEVKETVNEAVVGMQPAIFSFQHSKSGWTAGAGIENKFDLFGWFGPNFTTRTEYLYVDLGSTSDNFTYAGASETLSTKIRAHIWRSALVYKFSGDQ
jgi:outer membrane immunogenic protein